MRIYFDACCFNRPFDDPAIHRNHLEAEAVTAILGQVQKGHWTLIGSGAIELELKASPNEERRAALLGMLAAVHSSVSVGQTEYNRSLELVLLGFRRLDSLHVACAEAASCNVLLTTDDQFLHKALKLADQLKVEVRNPVDWLLEQ